MLIINQTKKNFLIFIGGIIFLTFVETILFLYFSQPKFLLFFIGFLSAFIIFYKPFWGLCLFAFMIPFETFLLIGGVITALKLIGLIIFIGWLFYFLLSKKNKIFLSPPIKISIFFATWAFASCLWASFPGAVLQGESILILLIGFFFLAPQIVTGLKKLHYFILSNVFGSIIAGGAGLYNFILHPDQRISTLAENAEHFAIAISVAIFYFFTLIISKSHKSTKIISFILFMALLIAAFTSQTRGFIVAFIISLFVFFGYWLYLKRQNFLKIFLVSGLIGLVIILIMPQIFFERLESIVTLSDKAAGRTDIWKAGLVMAIENPLLGVGLGNSWLNYAKYRDRAISGYHMSLTHPGALRELRDLHSVYLQILAELGIIGLILFLLFIISLAKKFYSSFKKTKVYSLVWRLGLVVGAQFLTLLIFAITEPVLIRKYFWFGFALVLTYCKIISNTSEAEINNKLEKQI
jgi:O-antigen ligase